VVRDSFKFLFAVGLGRIAPHFAAKFRTPKSSKFERRRGQRVVSKRRDERFILARTDGIKTFEFSIVTSLLVNRFLRH
jgi:hypothetical protein